MVLERRTLLTSFTQMSPIGLAPLLAQIPPAGGLVLDLIGINGGRIETELAPNQLFQGYFNSGTPAIYRGNPGTLGIQTGLTATALRSLGGGLAGVAVRVTMGNGQTGPGEPARNEQFLLLDGFLLGNFSSVVTQQTTGDGTTALSMNPAGGFRASSLDTGFFSSTDPTLLASLYNSIASTGEVVYQLQDNNPYTVPMDFTSGLDPGLVNPGPIPVFAIDPPLITSVQTSGPIAEGGAVTITVEARTAHENPSHPPVLTYQFDVLGNGSFALSNETGVATLSFFQPGTFVIPIRVVTVQGTFATTSAQIEVSNVAPFLDSPGNQRGTEGSPARVDLGAFTDPGHDSPWTVTIDWGDGTPDATFSVLHTGDLGTLIHTYELDGPYQVTLAVTDSPGATTRESFTEQIANVPPMITKLADTSPIRLGAATVLSLSFADPGQLDTFKLAVNWGDQTATNASLGVGTRTFTMAHDFELRPGPFEITVTITDHGGGQAVASTTVLVVASGLTLPPPSTPPPALSSLSSLAFFNSSSKSKAAASATLSAPASLLGPNQLPNQSIPTKKTPSGGRRGSAPRGGGRSLEELLAILLTQPPKRSIGLLSPFSSLVSPTSQPGQAATSNLANRASTGAGAQGPATIEAALRDGEDMSRAGGAASRIMLLVVWTLSLQNRSWRRPGRRSFSTRSPARPQPGV
jgi:hypothetical protein